MALCHQDNKTPMKTTTLTFLTLLLLSCSGRKDSASRFTTDDIAMLQLNKTKNITILEEAGRTVDLAPFLKTREYNLSDMIQTMVLIPLETTEESLLHSIRNIIVTDSSIFVHDERGGGGVVLFDRQGKFVKRIKTGKALKKSCDFQASPITHSRASYWP